VGRRARLIFAFVASLVTLSAAGGVVAFILTGDTEQQDHRAQVVGAVVATLLVVPSGIAWAWRWVAEHRPDDTPPSAPAAITSGTGRTLELDGDWFTAWQSFKDGQEVIAVQPVTVTQTGDHLTLTTLARGRPLEDGGYHWAGELRLWDNEILMGWYASTDTSVRSKGTLYFVLHPQGRRMTGRWVGLSYDGKTITGHGAMARTADDARTAITTH
jgi:hypothetical protein